MWPAVDWHPLVEFIRAHDPAAAERIRGATPETIRHLSALSSEPLPKNYLGFLEVMGEATGLEGFWEEQSFNASALLEAASNPKVDSATEPGFFRVAQQVRGDLSKGTDSYLDLKQGNEFDAPVVYRSASPETELEEDDDPLILTELLHEYAFKTYRLEPSLFQKASLLRNVDRGGAPVFERLISDLESSGFVSPFPKFRSFFCATKDEVQIALAHFPSIGRISVKLGSDDQASLKHWVQTLKTR